MDIQLHNICKSFEGRQVLQSLNWRVRDGECWRLSGTSGIGKTTLLRILMGLETPDSGEITGLTGVRISACFQEQRLCEWMSAMENLRLVCGAEITDAEISSALSVLLPPESLNQPAATLSGGMQRRVALVRALLPPSDLVLLDEPFSGLDGENIDHALDFIYAYRKKRALIVVSHEGHQLREPCQTFRM